jgi:hypothetical protein
MTDWRAHTVRRPFRARRTSHGSIVPQLVSSAICRPSPLIDIVVEDTSIAGVVAVTPDAVAAIGAALTAALIAARSVATVVPSVRMAAATEASCGTLEATLVDTAASVTVAEAMLVDRLAWMGACPAKLVDTAARIGADVATLAATLVTRVETVESVDCRATTSFARIVEVLYTRRPPK